MIRFEKVSYEQFEKDAINLGYDKELGTTYDSIITLPKRATSGSAGYDFVTPFDIDLKPGETVIVPTGIRCKMDSDVVLMLYPRSGIGFITGARLANSTGVIDSDYYYSDNEGHIMLKLVGGFDELKLRAGAKVMQGVFTHYLLAEDDETKTTRNGGFGSTDR